MSLDDLKLVYGVSWLALFLLAASPMMSVFVSFPGGERFSELWLLGEGHLTEGYPFNVEADEVYRVYVGVSNHLGGPAYYFVSAKFRNQSEALPNSTTGEPSPLPSFFEYRFFAENNETWESLLSFGFVGVSVNGNYCRVDGVMVNGRVFVVEKDAVWDDENRGFFYQLFFELWLYNGTQVDFEYHDRFVGLWLNVTGRQ